MNKAEFDSYLQTNLKMIESMAQEQKPSLPEEAALKLAAQALRFIGDIGHANLFNNYKSASRSLTNEQKKSLEHMAGRMNMYLKQIAESAPVSPQEEQEILSYLLKAGTTLSHMEEIKRLEKAYLPLSSELVEKEVGPDIYFCVVFGGLGLDRAIYDYNPKFNISFKDFAIRKMKREIKEALVTNLKRRLGKL